MRFPAISVAFLMAVLVGFGVWCGSLMWSLGELRHELESQMEWIAEIREIREELTAGSHDTAADRIPALTSEVAARWSEAGETVPASVAQLGHRVTEMRADGTGSVEVVAALGRLAQDIRRQNGRLLLELGRTWSSLYVLVISSAVLLLVTSALIVLSARREDRFERIKRRLQEQLEHQAEVEQRLRESEERYLRDVRDTRERLSVAERYDALTGLPNRHHFRCLLADAVTSYRGDTQRHVGVLLLDLNRLGLINQSLGHSAGDQLLCIVAGRIANAVGPDAVVARMGADEFAVLLAGVADEAEALDISMRVRDYVGQAISMGDVQLLPTAKMGLCINTMKDEDSDALLRNAGVAMERSRIVGRDHVQTYDPSMGGVAGMSLRIETELRRALDREEFVAFFQPLVSLDTTKGIGFEALIRWNHPSRGLVPPMDFVPIAEECGLIVPMGKWILRRSCQQLAAWKRDGVVGPDATVAVNLSAKQFNHTDLVRHVDEIILETGIEPEHLKLEITESVVMTDAKTAVQTLHRLKELGVRLCIDDFGTGYSSLSYLQRFPVDVLKVDRGFIRHMRPGSDDEVIVDAMVALSHSLGLAVVAEGIETAEQLERLTVMGCDYGQGYLFARPLPATDVPEFMEHWSKRARELFASSAPAHGLRVISAARPARS